MGTLLFVTAVVVPVIFIMMFVDASSGSGNIVTTCVLIYIFFFVLYSCTSMHIKGGIQGRLKEEKIKQEAIK